MVANCTCSELQLELVGCDCEVSHSNRPLMVAEVFLDGYASDNKGKFEFIVLEGFDPQEHAQKIFSYSARVFRTYRKYPAVDARTPAQREEDKARALYFTKGDNS